MSGRMIVSKPISVRKQFNTMYVVLLCLISSIVSFFISFMLFWYLYNISGYDIVDTFPVDKSIIYDLNSYNIKLTPQSMTYVYNNPDSGKSVIEFVSVTQDGLEIDMFSDIDDCQIHVERNDNVITVIDFSTTHKLSNSVNINFGDISVHSSIYNIIDEYGIPDNISIHMNDNSKMVSLVYYNDFMRCVFTFTNNDESLYLSGLSYNIF